MFAAICTLWHQYSCNRNSPSSDALLDRSVPFWRLITSDSIDGAIHFDDETIKTAVDTRGLVHGRII